jgi:hypothetical protein
MRRYCVPLEVYFRPEDELGKSHNLLWINAFKAQDVDFEYNDIAGGSHTLTKVISGKSNTAV